jgi:hypothetical protein
MVTEDQIVAILDVTLGKPQEAADRLVRAANRAGGVDNITAIVLEVEPGEPEAGTVAPAPSASATTGRRAPWRAIVAVVAIVVVLFAAYTAFRSYVDDQWYVGVSNGHVAIYQGVPAAPFGIELSHVDEETDLDAAAVERLQTFPNLPQGINYDSRDEAVAAIAQMRDDLKKQERQQR